MWRPGVGAIMTVRMGIVLKIRLETWNILDRRIFSRR